MVDHGHEGAHLPEIEVAVAELSDIRAAWRTIAR